MWGVHPPNTKAASWKSGVTQRQQAPYIFLISGYILSPNLKYTVEINSGAAEDAVGPIYYRKNLVCHSFQLGELPHCTPLPSPTGTLPVVAGQCLEMFKLSQLQNALESLAYQIGGHQLFYNDSSPPFQAHTTKII